MPYNRTHHLSHKCHCHSRRLHKGRRTRQGRQAGCLRSHNRLQGCRNIRTRKSRPVRCKCRKRQARQHMDRYRHKCRPCRRQQHKDRRTHLGRQADCLHNRNLHRRCMCKNRCRNPLRCHSCRLQDLRIQQNFLHHIQNTRQAGCRRSRNLLLGCQNNRSRRSLRDRCKCHSHRAPQHTHRCRRRCRPHQHRPHKDRRTRRGRQAGCPRSHIRQPGFRNIHSRRSRRDRCRCRSRQARQHMGQHRHRCHPCQHRPHKDHHTRQGHQTGCLRSHSLRLGCQNNRSRKSRLDHCRCHTRPSSLNHHNLHCNLKLRKNHRHL